MQEENVEKAEKTGKKKKGSGRPKKKRRRNYDDRIWKPGDPLTERDEQFLEEVRRVYRELGYVPAQHEVAAKGMFRRRFRLWRDVLKAAGLPGYNDPEQMRIRLAAKARQKEKEERDGRD